MVEADDVRVAGAEVVGRRVLAAGVLDVARRVGVPREEIEVLAEVVGVVPAEQGHVVVGDEPVVVRRAEYLDLLAVELDDAVATEPVVVEQPCGVVPGGGRPGRVDLVEAGVLLAPEGVAPRLVEVVDVVVALAEPLAEGGGAVVTVTPRRAVAAVLVVGLPAGDGVVAGEPLGHALDDARALPPVHRRVETVLAATTEPLRRPVGRLAQDARMFVAEPLRRGGGGRTEDRLHAVVADQVDGLGEPLEVVDARFGLVARPRELAHADVLDARFCHLCDLLLPLLPGPVLREVTDADVHGVRSRRAPPKQFPWSGTVNPPLAVDRDNA